MYVIVMKMATEDYEQETLEKVVRKTIRNNKKVFERLNEL